MPQGQVRRFSSPPWRQIAEDHLPRSPSTLSPPPPVHVSPRSRPLPTWPSWVTCGHPCGVAPPPTTTSSCVRLFRCSRIGIGEGHLCTRGCACSATCTKLLELGTTSCGVLYGAWRSGTSGGSMSRIRTRELLLPRTSPSAPSEAAGLPSGGRTVPACSAWNPSTPCGSAGRSRLTG